MDINVRQDQETVTIGLSGEIDEHGAEQLKNKFKELQAGRIKELVLDFAKVTYIGSAGIGKLLLFYKDMALNGGTIRVINISASIYELFTVLKLDSIFSLSKV